MTTQYTLSAEAETDLDEIGAYTTETWGLKRATRYVLALERCCEMLAAGPRLGRETDGQPGLFRLNEGEHVIFYRITASGIRVVRVLHQKMDPDRHL